MIKLILATDMAKHKEIYEKLRDFIPVFSFENQEHLDTVSFLIHFYLFPSMFDRVHFSKLKMILIKCCDISNEVRPSEVSEPWLDCLLEEYFMQVSWNQCFCFSFASCYTFGFIFYL